MPCIQARVPRSLMLAPRLLARLAILPLILGTTMTEAAASPSAGACTQRAYIANTDWMGGANSTLNGVWVVDTSSNQVITSIPMKSPYSPVFSQDRTKVYVSNSNAATVSVIDVATNTLTSTIALPANPIGLAPTPDGRQLLVTSGADPKLRNMFAPGSLRIVELATGEASAPITIGSVPERVKVSPNGRYAYAVNADRVLTVIDLRARKVRASIPLLGNAFAMEMTPDGRKIFLSLGRPHLVAVIDAVSNKVERYIPVGTDPIGLALNPDATKLYVTNRRDGSLSEISLATYAVTMTKKIGERPGLLRLSPDGRYAYVVYSTDKYVGVIDLEEMRKGPSMPLEGYRGFPGEVKMGPLPEIAKIETGAPTYIALC